MQGRINNINKTWTSLNGRRSSHPGAIHQGIRMGTPQDNREEALLTLANQNQKVTAISLLIPAIMKR